MLLLRSHFPLIQSKNHAGNGTTHSEQVFSPQVMQSNPHRHTQRPLSRWDLSTATTHSHGHNLAMVTTWPTNYHPDTWPPFSSICFALQHLFTYTDTLLITFLSVSSGYSHRTILHSLLDTVARMIPLKHESHYAISVTRTPFPTISHHEHTKHNFKNGFEEAASLETIRTVLKLECGEYRGPCLLGSGIH